MEKFYITTSIPYVNAAPHIGFALEVIQTDVLARYHRQKGEDVFFLTGTDEHGAKISKAAERAGVLPAEFVDDIAGKFRDLTKALNISNDDFIRTTDQKRHWPSVFAIWKKLKEQDDLYKKEYKGLYCVGCETFITKKDLQDGCCKLHKTKPEIIKEENYFFRLSKYEERIRKAIENGELRIIPESRKKEVLNFIKDGLADISVSRPKKDLRWGIPIPDDESQVFYVWIEALSNYITALGYPDGEKLKKFWPADVQVMGKDILRFHATIWPGILFALGLQLPKVLFVHGFLTVEGQKISKSLGNVIDPFELVKKYGTDAVRYFFLREISSTEDGDFSYEKFETRYNADLAGGLGNLVARTLALVSKFGVKAPKEVGDENFLKVIAETKERFTNSINEFQFHEALTAIWKLISFCDKYIEKERPWEESDKQKQVIGDLLFTLSEIAKLLKPLLPETTERIEKQIKSEKRELLFPRIT